LIDLTNAGRIMLSYRYEMARPEAAIASTDTCILKPYLFSTAAWIIGPPR
jgi:hypothetical protein